MRATIVALMNINFQIHLDCSVISVFSDLHCTQVCQLYLFLVVFLFCLSLLTNTINLAPDATDLVMNVVCC